MIQVCLRTIDNLRISLLRILCVVRAHTHTQHNTNRAIPIHCVYAFVIFSYVCSLRTHQPSFNMLKKVFLDGHFDRKNFFLWNNKVESRKNLCCNQKSRFPLKKKVNIQLEKLIQNKIDSNSSSEYWINWCVKVFAKWKENA